MKSHAGVAPSAVIKYIQLFGERGSGTNFVASLIRKNLAHVELTNDFGAKHWYIKDHYPRCAPNRSTDFECVRPLKESSDTLFLVLFRDPFDWLNSIHARPYHAWEHWGLPFSEFIRKPWYSFETSRVNSLWPDNEEKHWPIEHADNVLKLRSMKIKHFLTLQRQVTHVVYVRYESISTNLALLGDIAQHFSIPLKGSEIEGERKHFGQPDTVEYSRIQYPEISSDDLAFIQQQLDWDVEKKLEYTFESYQR